MIGVNTLINNAMQRCSLVGDGQAATGTQAMAALNDLKCVIGELNTENDLLENVATYDSFSSEKITFATRPKGWFEVENEATIELMIADNRVEVGNIIKTRSGEHTFYYIDMIDTTLTMMYSEEFEEYMRDKWPTHFINDLPDRVIGCARKIGNRYVQLAPADKMTLDSYTKGALATMYTSESEVLDVEVPVLDPSFEPYTVEYFVIEFNSYQASDFRITILKSIPDIEIDSTLHISHKYESLIENGLCVKLCIRYKLMEALPMFEQEYESDRRLIMRINHANRPLTYGFANGRGYDYNYYNLLGGPVEW